MSGVRMLHFFERLKEIHSNLPILYYGFNCVYFACFCFDLLFFVGGGRRFFFILLLLINIARLDLITMTKISRLSS